MRRLLIALALILAAATPGLAETELYPAIEPYKTGMLAVSDMHEIYWEASGNPDGIPALILHGGPGVGSSPGLRRMLDPKKYHIIAFDQRGCGKSTPFFEWRDNTTQDLIEDINKLRSHLGITGKVVFWGLSWGTTLGLAYAEQYPENVGGLILVGVFTGTKREVDFLYHGGAAAFYPEIYARFQSVIPNPDRLDYPRQLFEIISGDDKAAAERAANAAAFYEIKIAVIERTVEDTEKIMSGHDFSAFGLLSTYYISNGCFLEEGQLLRDAARLGDIPVFISNGNQDVVTPPMNAHTLAAHLTNVRLEIVPGCSHNDTGVFLAAIEGSQWIADQIEASPKEAE